MKERKETKNMKVKRMIKEMVEWAIAMTPVILLMIIGA